MNEMKNYLKTWFIPLLLLVIIVAGCDDRVGLITPPIVTTPTVSSTNPANAATAIPFNQKVSVTFSELMDSTTVTTATFTLMQGTSFVAGTVSYIGTTATFSPASNLSPNTTYTGTITTMAKSLEGRGLVNNYVWSFTTGAAAFITPPSVIATDPLNAATSVPINQKIAATFSVDMDATTITASTFTLMRGSSPVPGFVSYAGTTALFTAASYLLSNTAYTATITTGAKDLAGNAVATDYVWSFTTGAAAVITPPVVSSTDPVDLATGVPLNQKIAATFSKTLDASTMTTATFTLKNTSTSAVVAGFVSYSGTTAIFAPAANLSATTSYTATITTGAKDLAGNALAANYVWSFTTGAAVVITPPLVSSTDPINAATGVALNQKIAATFSKTMDASTITTATFTLKNTATSASVSGFVSYSGVTALFTPAANLAATTVYTATITTAAKDLAGNALENTYSWSFTTGAAAIVTPPIVSSTDPIDLKTGVPLNQKIAATFSKTMDASTITASTFTIKNVTTSTTVAGFVSYSGQTAIFSPTSNLDANTPYMATITTGAKDLAGNGLVQNYVWNFTTGAAAVVTPPIVTSTDPIDLKTGVPLNQKVAATFSKTMDATTITTATFTLKLGTTSVAGFVSYSGTTAIFAPTNNLIHDTVYTATITTGAKDLAGNALALNYVWTFRTGAAAVIIPPVVTSTDPINLATGVAVNKHISAVFSKTMDASTITTASFTLMQGSSFVAGTVSYVGSTATYVPSNDLAMNTTYTATITTGAKDLAGNALAVNYVWSFKTSNSYTVLLSANPLLGGTVNGAGIFNAGSLVTVTATPNSGYTFVEWTENSLSVSTNPTYAFTINNDRTLVGVFTVVKYSVDLSSNPVAGGSTLGKGIFNTGSSVTVTATANTGYKFTNWTEGVNIVSTNANYQFIILADRVLVANFIVGPGGLPINLGSAANFAVLAGSAVSNTGVTTHIYGDVGSFPTATINGLNSTNVDGILYMSADPLVGTAKNDLTTAYNEAQGRSLNAISLPGQLGGLTLAPGLYVNSISSGISGTGSNAILTLDAGGDANAVWVFKMGSTLITDAGTSIVLAGGAKWENIFWSVGTSATFGTNSIFFGNVLADQSITLTTGAVLTGRALTRIGAVTLDANIVDKR